MSKFLIGLTLTALMLIASATQDTDISASPASVASSAMASHPQTPRLGIECTCGGGPAITVTILPMYDEMAVW